VPVSNCWNGSVLRLPVSVPVVLRLPANVFVSSCWNGSVLKLPVSKRSERGEKNIECSIMGRLWRQQ